MIIKISENIYIESSKIGSIKIIETDDKSQLYYIKYELLWISYNAIILDDNNLKYYKLEEAEKIIEEIVKIING